jgi:hypothetical protein
MSIVGAPLHARVGLQFATSGANIKEYAKKGEMEFHIQNGRETKHAIALCVRAGVVICLVNMTHHGSSTHGRHDDGAPRRHCFNPFQMRPNRR